MSAMADISRVDKDTTDFRQRLRDKTADLGVKICPARDHGNVGRPDLFSPGQRFSILDNNRIRGNRPMSLFL
jgi:hypothetical protein